MATFDDRFGAAFRGRGFQPIPMPPVPGLTLGSNPNIQGNVDFQQALAPPPPAAPPPPVNAEPYRMQGNPADYQAWRTSAPIPTAAPQRPAPFPAGGTAPVPNVAAPTGPGGITLNSAPTAPGWAGTVGLPATPEASSAFDRGADWQKMLGLAGDVAKGIKGKAPTATDMNTITPMSPSPVGGGGGQMGAELLAQLLSARRRNYGVG